MNEPVSMTIGKLARLSKRISDRCLLPYGLRTSEFRFLGWLMDNGVASHKDLQAEFRMTRATVSQLVDRLYKEGFVSAEVSTADRRQWVLCITEKGRAVFATALHDIQRLDERVAEAFTEEELSAFSSISDRLIKLFEEELC